MALFDWFLPSQTNPDRQSIRAKLACDPYYRLQSFQEIAIAVEMGITIDVNKASVDDWLRLPGISIHQARSLVELSKSGVQFCCLEDIAAVLGVSLQRLKPLGPILSFCYYEEESLLIPVAVNPNTAGVEQLAKIPAVDLFLARAIVQNRIEVGNYRNLADLQQRLSLSPQLTSQLMYYLRF